VKVHHVMAEATTSALPEAAWILLCDRSTWPSWSPLGSHSNERPGADGTADGLGSIALFVTGPYRSREEIVELDPPKRLSYVLLSGLPLRDYRAVVELTPEGAGSRIRWSATFVPQRPGTGWVYRLVLGRVFRGMVTGLAAAARDTRPV
jgi:Polyketide cyclase / dehydrase and lipid transport